MGGEGRFVQELHRPANPKLGVVVKMPRENSSRPNPFAKLTSPSHRLPFSTLHPFPIVPSENLARLLTRLALSSDSVPPLRSSLLGHPRVPHVLPCFEHRTPFRVGLPVFQSRPFITSLSLFRENNSLVTARLPNAMRGMFGSLRGAINMPARSWRRGSADEHASSAASRFFCSVVCWRLELQAAGRRS